MNNKVIMILMSAICVVMIAFGALLFMMWSKLSSLDALATKDDSGEAVEEESANPIGPVFPLESFIVNLDDPKYRKYLRVTMDLELRTKEDNKEIEERLPQIRDCILTILPAKNYDQVATIDGKNKLRQEILTALNGFFKKELIANIFFTEFVIQ